MLILGAKGQHLSILDTKLSHRKVNIIFLLLYLIHFWQFVNFEWFQVTFSWDWLLRNYCQCKNVSCWKTKTQSKNVIQLGDLSQHEAPRCLFQVSVHISAIEKYWQTCPEHFETYSLLYPENWLMMNAVFLKSEKNVDFFFYLIRNGKLLL